MSDLIKSHLEQNNTIISEVKVIIQSEIKEAISKLKQDMQNEMSLLSEASNINKIEIDTINKKKEKLTEENTKLTSEINEINYKITAPEKFENHSKTMFCMALANLTGRRKKMSTTK